MAKTPSDESLLVSLAHPSVELFESFQSFVAEMRAAGQTLWGPYLPREGETPTSFVERLRAREVNPETPYVPETVYWGVRGGMVVGRISLRHRLDENLAKLGGHIGYEVRPSVRRQGIAKEMLRLLVLTPKAKEIGKMLLTCSPTNPASNRTILVNGGVLERTISIDSIKEERNHYWISV